MEDLPSGRRDSDSARSIPDLVSVEHPQKATGRKAESRQYLIRRRIGLPTRYPLPDTTFSPESFARPEALPPIKANAHDEALAQVKVYPVDETPIPPIPHYENVPPKVDPVDVRTNAASLQHDIYVMRRIANRDRTEKENEPTQFLEWQTKMKELDAEQRKEVIQKRHDDLNFVRRRAMKVRKQRIADHLELGKEMRLTFGEEFAAIQREIEEERRKIHELKKSLIDGAPNAVAKAKRAKVAATKEFKKLIRSELREAEKRRADEVFRIKQNATVVRHQTETHTLSSGPKYTAKREITETTFLAALSDEETAELLAKHSEAIAVHIEEQIEEHRQQKAAKMDKFIAMLDEATRVRDAKEEAHIQQRRARIEEEAKIERASREEEAEKMLLLEKRLQKKRRLRIQEAEEMQEHMKTIAARNRYLALNKRARQTATFESQQDAKLRTAKERQTMRMPPEKIAVAGNQKPERDLAQLKELLGL
jgi:hypothetical protein